MSRDVWLARLERADAIRIARARAKDTIHADPTWRALELAIRGRTAAGSATYLEGARVWDLLTAASRVGPVKARALLVEAGVPSMIARGVTVRELGERRRVALTLEVRRLRVTQDDQVVAAAAANPRHRQRPTPTARRRAA